MKRELHVDHTYPVGVVQAGLAPQPSIWQIIRDNGFHDSQDPPPAPDSQIPAGLLGPDGRQTSECLTSAMILP
jgi:hypothetical protein